MKLIVGLGNPEPKYKKTWHNIGFTAIDNISDEFSFDNFKEEKKFKSNIATGQIGDEKIILTKPQTYMNNSGEAVGAIAKYYKIKSEDIIIIHDDIDLPLGRLKIATGSSAGGHNGIKSIIQHTKTKDFIRIKIGVATAKKDRMDSADYVLSRVGILQLGKTKEIIKKTTAVVTEVVNVSLKSAMNKFN
jgi:peptidyl-tRNA hydrolase, PTH1 family